MRTVAEVVAALRGSRFIPVVTISDHDRAVPLGEALLESGLTLVEVTFRSASAARAITRLRANLPELVVAAGTVTDAYIVERAVDAGAAFVVSPGLNPEVVDYCVERNIPIVPGANDASAIEVGRAHGVSVFNFFPAVASGGPAMLTALAAPFADVEFLCSGGITGENLGDYLSIPQVTACAGSWVAPRDAIDAARFDEIRANARATVGLIRGLDRQPDPLTASGGR